MLLQEENYKPPNSSELKRWKGQIGRSFFIVGGAMKIKDGDLKKEVYVQGFGSLCTALNAKVQPGEWVR